MTTAEWDGSGRSGRRVRPLLSGQHRDVKVEPPSTSGWGLLRPLVGNGGQGREGDLLYHWVGFVIGAEMKYCVQRIRLELSDDRIRGCDS